MFVQSSGKVIIIPRGHVVLWSGEYIHAGSAYEVSNSRLFIAISSLETVSNLVYVERVDT